MRDKYHPLTDMYNPGEGDLDHKEYQLQVVTVFIAELEREFHVDCVPHMSPGYNARGDVLRKGGNDLVAISAYPLYLENF